MSSLRVLVVDGDAAFRERLAAEMAAAGCAVEQAGGVAAARRAINLATPDLLLTDLSLPDGDGIELIASVRRDQPGLRVMAFSAKRMVGVLDLLNLAGMLGAEAALLKPFEPKDLVSRLEASGVRS